MKAYVLSSSPRKNGNSATLATSVRDGLIEAGHEDKIVYADDILGSFLKDCRQCRKVDGECAIEDGFRSSFLNDFLQLMASSPRHPFTGTACRRSSKPFLIARFVTTQHHTRAPPKS